jgi:hypothetical protein
METFRKKNNIQGRVNTSPYSISASQLQAVRFSVLVLIGVAFHHALDDQGTHHFIVSPIDLTFSVWSPLLGGVYLDANTNSMITKSQARSWVENYQEAHPSEVWFHFFGSNIFTEIAAIPFFNTLQIEPAINDVDFTPQLLLIVEDEQTSSAAGRTQSTMVVYDASSPCPPCPAKY